MLLSVDWDFYAGANEHVFDSPLWGSPDLEYHRFERWQELARKRGGSSWKVLREDFPLFGNPLELLKFFGLPCYVALSHDSGFEWLEQVSQASPQPLLNLDSHHDLYSSSGDTTRIRPGNWAGHALERGLISHYTCIYPRWHAEVAVSEGYDCERTWTEIGARFSRTQVTLERVSSPEQAIVPSDISSLLLVQSPAWTNPLYDVVFLELCRKLQAQVLSPPMARAWS